MAVANAVQVVLGVVVLVALVAAARSHRASLLRFAAWPFSVDGWRCLLLATAAIPLALWRLLGAVAQGRVGKQHFVTLPVAFVLCLAAVNIWYIPFRDGVQVLAGLDRNFTRDAWGGAVVPRCCPCALAGRRPHLLCRCRRRTSAQLEKPGARRHATRSERSIALMG